MKTFAREEETQLRLLREHFSESEICTWVHQYFNRHKQYITGIKFVLTNVCYSKIIEGTLYMHIERACYDREFYDGLREAYQLAKYDHVKVPEFLEMWIAETISPAHRPPKKTRKCQILIFPPCGLSVYSQVSMFYPISCSESSCLRARQSIYSRNYF